MVKKSNSKTKAKAEAKTKPQPKSKAAPKSSKPKLNLAKSQPRQNEDKPRKLKQATHKSFRSQRKTKPPKQPKLLGSFKLFKRSISALTNHWRLFLGIIVVYLLLDIILAGALSVAGSSNLGQMKTSLAHNFSGFTTGLTLFTYLAGSSTISGGAQLLIAIVVSLALIWSLRQIYIVGREREPRVRDAFYRGMTPLIQFILVLVVIALELVPMAIGAVLYSVVVNNNIAITFFERAIFAVIFFLLSVASLHMLTSSVFAAYIVTLQDMTPIKALRSAVHLVRYRRGRIFLKLLFVIVALTVVAAIIIIPLALWLTPFAPYAFLILSLFFLAIFHSYVYALYRELI